jgi:hypothetical protein
MIMVSLLVSVYFASLSVYTLFRALKKGSQRIGKCLSFLLLCSLPCFDAGRDKLP